MNHKNIQNNIELNFLKSAITTDNPFNSTTQVLQWVNQKNRETQVDIVEIDFNKLEEWNFINNFEKLSHNSGKFFSIEGISVNTNWGKISNWDQPIINQPEIGLLGIITKEIDGVLYFLLQAKIEPGNINKVQLSPTLQATKSNYTRVHNGNKPHYLEYFLNKGKSEILLDQLQSEQGARFLKKRNRNIIIKVNENITILPDFCWVTLGQIQSLLKFDNIVNMDTRTVISGINFGKYSSETINFFNLMNNNTSISSMYLKTALDDEASIFSFNNIIQWFTNLKVKYELEIKKTPLINLKNWEISNNCIFHIENKYFKVVAVNVIIQNREVTNWQQPLIKPLQEGICAFIVKEINNVLHFIVQAKVEPGNYDILEMAPTVQCITDNYKNDESQFNVVFSQQRSYIITHEFF
jgi:oxidase EvaA